MKLIINSNITQQTLYEWCKTYAYKDKYKKTLYIFICLSFIAICNCKQANAVLRGLVAKNNYPYSYIQDGQLTGLNIEVAQLVSKEINWPITVEQEKSGILLNRLLIKEEPVIDFIILHAKQIAKLDENIRTKLDISDEVFDNYYIVIPSSIIMIKVINYKIAKIKKSNEYLQLLKKYKFKQ